MRRSALNLAYDEEPMPDINPEALDFRVASGLFAGLREWNESTAETLNLLARLPDAAATPDSESNLPRA